MSPAKARMFFNNARRATGGRLSRTQPPYQSGESMAGNAPLRSSQGADKATRGERNHQARNSAEEHADSNECPEYPFRTGRPGSPNQDGKNQGDNAIYKEPSRSGQRPQTNCEDEFEYGLREQIDCKGERERYHAIHGA